MRKITLAALGLTALLAGCSVPGMPAGEEQTEMTPPAAVEPAPATTEAPAVAPATTVAPAATETPATAPAATEAPAAQ